MKMIAKRIRLNLFNHLLACHTTAYTLGILFSSAYILPVVSALTYTILPTVLLALFSVFFKRDKFCTAIASLLLFFATGYFQGLITSESPADSAHLYNLVSAPEDVVLIGHIQTMPSFDGTTSRVLIAATSLQKKGESNLRRVVGTALIRMRFQWPQEIEPGTRVVIRTTLHRPSRYNTPGAFDYPAYLARKGIWITGYVRSPSQISAIHSIPQNGETIRHLPERLRTRIGSVLDSRLPGETSSLYRALLLGDRTQISPQTLEAFKQAGVMHILAISGIHMSLIAILLFTVCYWLLRRSTWLILHCNTRKIAGLLCLPILVGYALLAGLNTPVLRACIVSCVVIFAFCTDRPKTFSSLISVAVLLLLATNPQSLFTVSFQLTFAAFISILMVMPILKRYARSETSSETRLRRIVSRSLQWTFAGITASTAAVLGTAPILTFHFHRLPLLGPISNLIIEPLICLWALPLGFLALPFIFLVPDISAVLLKLGAIGLQLGVTTANLFAALPHTSLWLPPPHCLLLLSYYFTFFLVLFFLQQPRKTKLTSTIAQCSFAICLTGIIFPHSSLFGNHDDNTTTIHFLDLGQGSATVVEFADGKTVLIDGGALTLGIDSVGQSVIAPFLWQRGITRLNAILITHQDSDHYNGVPFLLEQFTPDVLWSGTESTKSYGYQRLLSLAKQFNVRIETPYAGDLLRIDGEDLNPSILCLANLSHHDQQKTNNRGIVLAITGFLSDDRVDTRNPFQLIFPGDISSEMELEVISKITPSNHNILLASHHGSAESNCPDFLRHISPEAIISSAGRSRTHQFPSPMLRDYCEVHRIPLLVTAEHGTIRVLIKGGTPFVLVREQTKNPLRRSHTWLQPQRVTNTLTREASTSTLR
ncbi:DNA internalization-related competence protein ComEC/Rec2 [Desulfosediminicola ganghwensis]|uniref:DNA internalization-related competence protein ComEC/Rec2 n=1 Tax=Desulfosediminicola ganghwensis TaxID=2569540 RepID=UPI0010AD2AC3|nr:DNA internalization-related competence protein ComEC/Rec2 [Desulfosediminicola ganghwensis]